MYPSVSCAYYFLGFKGDEEDMYAGLQKSGFVLMFNDRGENLESGKKGNVDTNLVFSVMKSLIEDDFDKIILVSGDGDYMRMVDYLIEKNKFKTIIVPSSNVSSLYNKLGRKSGDYFVRINKLRDKIEYKRDNKKKKPR